MDIVEQPCQVTALHHIGKYGGLGGAFFLPHTVCKWILVCYGRLVAAITIAETAGTETQRTAKTVARAHTAQ